MLEGGRHHSSQWRQSPACKIHFVRAPTLGSDQADDIPRGDIWMPLMDQTHWANAFQSSIRGWALTDGGQQEALLQAVMSCYGRPADNGWFWRRITSSVFLEAAIQDLEAHYGQGREGLDQLLAWVIGAMGEVGVTSVRRRSPVCFPSHRLPLQGEAKRLALALRRGG
jgi:hypothetical protein